MQDALLKFVEKKVTTPAAPAASQATRSLAKGIAAGIVAGLIATAAKSLAEKIFPPRTHGEPEPPEVLAEKIAGHQLAPVTKYVAAETIHWTFGAATGAAYGALAEFYPAATARDGATFGMTLAALTHEGALPALGLSAPPAQQTTREKYSEIATHVVFGVVAETVRRTIRKRI